MTAAYGVCLVLSLAVIIYMAQKNYENVNVQYWSIVVLIPIIEGAYFLSTIVTTVEASYLTYCFMYIDSTVLVTLLLFLLLRIINVEIKPWGKIIAYELAFAHMLLVLFCFNTPHYYKEMTIVQTKYGNYAEVVRGPLIYVHYAYLLGIFVSIIAVIVIGFLRKGTYSLWALTMNTIIILVGLLLYLVETLTGAHFSMLPFLYLVAELTFAGAYNYSRAHEISSVVSQQQSTNATKGYMILGMNRRFLGCNEKCIDFIPSLKTQRIDEKLPKNSELRGGIDHFIEAFEKGERNTARFQVGDRIWICDISHFTIEKGGKNQGYLFELRDATDEEKTFAILQAYNETLNAEVKKKTEEIKEIQGNILSGMANMIENRDSSTGGHVKRTSDVVKIIIDEINKEGKIKIDEQTEWDIIRSAPMHDLGKITIDSGILCKPGKLTDEEYAIMKSHAVKSGEIVKILLEGVEEKSFVDTCYKVARYHHERWDGSGYPDGLKGEEILLGARIMALADVWDALVSKRCYKEPMSFDKATEIMLDGMGKSFDPDLKEVFLGCKEKLEAYYSAAE